MVGVTVGHPYVGSHPSQIRILSVEICPRPCVGVSPTSLADCAHERVISPAGAQW